jgi:hypothetical protein
MMYGALFSSECFKEIKISSIVYRGLSGGEKEFDGKFFYL